MEMILENPGRPMESQGSLYMKEGVRIRMREGDMITEKGRTDVLADLITDGKWEPLETRRVKEIVLSLSLQKETALPTP